MSYQPLSESRRNQEFKILDSIKRQNAEGALYQLVFNALMQPQRHLRTSILALCKQQGYCNSKATTALFVLEMADWVRTHVDGLEVVVFLTEHAKLTGSA